MNRRASSWLRVGVPACMAAALVGCDRDQPLEPLNAAVVGGVKPPSGTSVRPTSSSAVLVTWTDNTTNETGFRIERSATNTGPWATAGTTDPNVTSFDDGGRASEQQVCYRVVATLPKGQSNASNTSCTTPPAAPVGFTATVFSPTAIDLAWTDNSAVEDGYEIERATAVGGPYSTVAFVAANTTTYRQGGLITNTTYWYRVRANNDFGYGDCSNVASATPAFLAPKAPSGTNVRPSSSVTAFITWIDNSVNETGFRVQRSTDLGATWITYYTPSANRTFANDFGLAIEKQVCYRVKAFNAQGDSPPSDVDCTTPPAGPTDLTVAVVDPQTNDLAWTDKSAVEDGYAIERSDGTTAFTVVAHLAANSTHYRDVGVTGGVVYRVRATKDSGGSNYSNVAGTAPPQAPVAIAAMPWWSSRAVAISWTASSTNIAAFRVERSTDRGGTWVRAATGAGIPDFYFYDRYQFVDGATSEQEVCYRVIAFNNAGDSPPSNTKCTAPPAGATNLRATWAEDGMLFTWTDNSAVEDGYTVVLTTDCPEQSEVWLGGIPANATSYVVTGVWSCLGAVPGAFVVVMKDGGYGDSSNWASPSEP
jgi:hypothetical protein